MTTGLPHEVTMTVSPLMTSRSALEKCRLASPADMVFMFIVPEVVLSTTLMG